MRLRTILLINALILGTSGTCAVLLPAQVCSLYGVSINPEVMMMAQYAGLGSIAIALISLLARKVRDTYAQQSLTLAFCIIHGVGAIISIQNTISGVIKWGWPIVILYSIFAIAYAYCYFKKRSG